MKSLDVGCGASPKGTVNVDLFIESTVHRSYKIKPKHIKNFVQADACHLPFKKDSFDMVYCFHVVEHVQNPILLIRELIRVSKKQVIIECPHWISWGAKKPGHINFFRTNWFHKVLANYTHDILLNWGYNKIPLLPLPQEIIVKIWK